MKAEFGIYECDSTDLKSVTDSLLSRVHSRYRTCRVRGGSKRIWEAGIGVIFNTRKGFIHLFSIGRMEDVCDCVYMTSREN